MIKKFATVAATGAAFLSIANFAMADYRGQRSSGGDIEIENEDTLVIGFSFASADSGDNTQLGSGNKVSRCGRSGGSSSQGIRTGNTEAIATTAQTVNSTTIATKGCDRCSSRGDIEIENEDTLVAGGAVALADSGDNSQRARGSAKQWTRTGSSTADAMTTAGVNLVSVTRR